MTLSRAYGGGASLLTGDQQRSHLTATELARFFELSTDVLCTIDGDRKLTHVNPAFENLVGKCWVELRGQRFLTVLYSEDQAQARAALTACAKGEGTREFESRCRSRHEHEIWIRWTATADRRTDLLYLSGKDISGERQQLRSGEELCLAALLAELRHGFAQSLATQEIFCKSVAAIAARMSASSVCIFTRQRPPAPLELIAASGNPTVKAAWADSQQSGANLLASLASTGDPLITNQVETDDRLQAAIWMRRLGVTAFAAYPLLGRSGVDGLLAVTSPQAFTDAALEALDTIAIEMGLFLQGQEADNARHEISRALSTLLSSSPLAIVCLDREQNVTVWNPAAERLFGWTEAEALGRRIPIIPPEREPEFQLYFDQELKGHATLALETVRRRSDGSRLAVRLYTSPMREAGGAVKGTMTLVSDITAAKSIKRCAQAGQNAMALLTRTRTLQESAPAVLRILADTGGWPYGELWTVDSEGNQLHRVGCWHPPSKVLDAFDAGSRELALARGVDLAGRIWEHEAPLTVRGLHTMPDSLRCAAAVQAGLHDAFGVPVRSESEVMGVLLFYAAEMSEPESELLSLMNAVSHQIAQVILRIRTEDTLRLTQGHLQQSQKMEALGVLAGGVAHDFNNLLTIILGYSEVMLDDVPEDSPLREMISEIHDAGKRASSLTRQLLAVSRKQVFEPVTCDLNELVTNMLKMLRRLIGEDIVLETTLESQLYSVTADPAQIEQVLLNLVVNARDAMPQGGRLTLATANIQLDARFARTHPGTAPGSYVVLEVRDTGIGMDEQTKARVCEPFFTTKEAGKGTGMGLATVYGIVKQSGGQLLIESELGRGTAFQIYLPRARGELLTRVVDREAFESPRGSETVLLVEDEQVVRNLVRKILEGHGYSVIVAVDGPEAIELFEAARRPIDLLLTDVIMPGMNGPELARRLKHARPDLKVLCMSGYTDDVVLSSGGMEPGMRFLQKPFTGDALTRKVREILDRSTS